MTLNVTGGLNWAEVLAPDTVVGAKPEFAIVTTLTARPGTLFTLGTRAIEGGFSVDYTVSDPSDNQGQVVRASGRLSLPLFNPPRAHPGLRPLRASLGHHRLGPRPRRHHRPAPRLQPRRADLLIPPRAGAMVNPS
jgi:hypothetical protein